MKTETPTSERSAADHRRKPTTATLLSLILPGLGHVYCGDFLKGIVLMGISSILMILALLIMVMAPHGAGFSIAAILLVLDMAVWIYAISSAKRLALQTGSDYKLRVYNNSVVYALLICMVGLNSGIGFALLVREKFLHAFKIPTSSMSPTLEPGDFLLTRVDAFLEEDPERGDLVIFRNPENRKQFYVSRAVALGGDTVELREGELFLNGKAVKRVARDEESDTWLETVDNSTHKIRVSWEKGPDGETDPKQATNNFGPVNVPRNHCFVLGDNRSKSRDSRHYGTISISSLFSEPTFRFWSSDLGRIGGIE